MDVKINWGDSFRGTFFYNCQKVKELSEKASRPDGKGIIPALLSRLQKADSSLLDACREELGTMVYCWRDLEMTKEMAEVCLVLAEKSMWETPIFHEVLNKATKLLVPPAFAYDGLFNVLSSPGAPVAIVARMVRNSQNFNANSYCFVEGDNPCGWFKNCKFGDKLNGRKTFVITSLDNANSQWTVPVSHMFLDGTFFQFSPKTIEFADVYRRHGKDGFDEARWVNEVKRNAILPITDEHARKIIQLTCRLIDEGKTIAGNLRTTELPSRNPPKPEPPKRSEDMMDPWLNYVSYKRYRSLNQGVADGVDRMNESNEASPNKKMGADGFSTTSQIHDASEQLQNAIPVKFKDIVVRDKVVLGCVVTLAYLGGGKVKYTILCDGDADPDRNYISCKGDFAQMLRGEKVGNTFYKGPRYANIEAIEPLPPELIQELDCDE